MDWMSGERGLTLSGIAWMTLDSYVDRQRQTEASGGSYEYHDGAEFDDPDEDVLEIWDDDIEEDDWDDGENVDGNFSDTEDE